MFVLAGIGSIDDHVDFGEQRSLRPNLEKESGGEAGLLRSRRGSC